jgi:hypothetical protein
MPELIAFEVSFFYNENITGGRLLVDDSYFSQINLITGECHVTSDSI